MQEKRKYKKNRHKFTDEEIDFLRQNVKGSTLKELTEMFNNKFNLNVDKNSISNQKKTHNLRSGYNCGHFNKCHKYTKGRLPYLTKPVGYETVDFKGDTLVKIANPNKWKLKHHLIYENAYNVKIKPKECIIFLDGDKSNFDINNLMKVNNTEQLLLSNIQKNMKIKNAEITKAIIQTIRIQSKINTMLNKE